MKLCMHSTLRIELSVHEQIQQHNIMHKVVLVVHEWRLKNRRRIHTTYSNPKRHSDWQYEYNTTQCSEYIHNTTLSTYTQHIHKHAQSHNTYLLWTSACRYRSVRFRCRYETVHAMHWYPVHSHYRPTCVVHPWTLDTHRTMTLIVSIRWIVLWSWMRHRKVHHWDTVLLWMFCSPPQTIEWVRTKSCAQKFQCKFLLVFEPEDEYVHMQSRCVFQQLSESLSE